MVRAAGLSLLALRALTLPAQTPNHPDLKTGAEIFRAACATCHGADGKGSPDSALGFEKPSTFPDFTRCDQTTPEHNVDWKATIRDGGHARGFSPIMPSFGESLTLRQIDSVVDYLRGFCREKAGPRGELNLPRPLVTGKAYPEDEVAITPAINLTGAPDVTMEVEYEQRVGSKYQLELSMPLGVEPYNNDVLDQLASRSGLKLTYGGRKGLGDAGIGLKRVVWSSYRTGSILSLEGKINLPLGPPEPRLGDGVTAFDGSILFAQRFPGSFFVETQLGSMQPIRTTDVPSAVYSYTTIGRNFRESGGLGRIWSPMLEFLADRPMQPFAKTNWDLAPQVQVSLSKRQHVRAAIGLRIPASNVLDRHTQLMFSVYWDWFDGGLREGWK